jgi:hypothetical protein
MVTDNFEDLGADWTLILKWIFKKWYEKAWIGFVRLNIGTGGRHW